MDSRIHLLICTLFCLLTMPDQTAAGDWPVPPGKDDGETWLAAGDPPRLSIGGEWEYRLDPENKGLEEKWYVQRFRAEGSLQLPGTLDDAGIGRKPELTADTISREVMLHLTRKHQYEGVAWYRREVIVPESWEGKETSLFLERALWKTTLWIDGKEAGSRESLNTPHEYDLGKLLSPGRHVLVLRIDNSKQYDISYKNMAHAYTNETQIMWNGVIGDMYLAAVPDAAISSVQVFPDVEARTATAVLKLESRFAEAVKSSLRLTVFSGERIIQQRKIALNLSPGQSTHRTTLLLGPDAELWDEFNPHLYTLRAELGATAPGSRPDHPGRAEHPAAEIAKAAATFGLREFHTDKEQLFLNGRRLFLRGTLECSIFPLTGYPPAGKKGWEKVFTAARSYGLNHLRFHSWCPPEAAFEVADSMGFYLQAELPLWAKDFGEDTATVRFIREEAERMIAAYGNHPSFCFWSLGNELQGDFDLMESLLVELKERDPRRLYTTTTFTFQGGHGDWPETQDDFFVTQWTKKGWVRGQGIFNTRYPDFNTDYSVAIEGISVPVITHEIGQYSVYPNLDEIKKYTGVLEPLNFIAVRNDLRRKGLLKYADEFTLASGKLSVLLYKEEIERALKTRGLSGFQLLDLHDFPGQGTALVGILDAFWDSKGLVDAEVFRQFCSPVVPLLRFPKAVYTNDEYFEAAAELSNYSAEDLENLRAEWKVTGREGAIIATGKFEAATIPAGSLASLGTIRTPLAGLREAAKLNVTITIPGTDYRNEWPIWVYPASLSDRTKPGDLSEVVFTRSATEALKLLAEGRKVLLNPDTSQLKGVDGRFTQVFWSPVHFPNQPGTMGLLCDPEHPALADFPTDFHTNWQWWDLVMHSKSMVIDSLPPAEPLVRVIDNFFKNRKMALVLEAKVGKGRLVICSADISSDLENRPAARQLRYSLLTYMKGGSFRPETVLEKEDVRSLVKSEATSLILKLDETRQTIHSFGASDCWTAKFIGTWADEEKKNRIADLLFSMDTLDSGSPEGIGLSLWRFNIGAGSFEQGVASGIRTDWRREESFLNPDGSYDWEKQQGQQWFLEAARERGVKYSLGFSIAPPVSMAQNGKAFSPGGNSLNLQTGKLDDLAAFLAKVAGHFRFDYLSPVNEPQWDWAAKGNGASQEGSPAKNSEISRLVKLLSKEIASAGGKTEVVVGEAGQWNYLYERNKDGRGDQVREFFSPASPNYIGGLPNVLNVISGHSYWTTCPDSTLTGVRQQVAQAVASVEPAPAVWQTEFGILGNICDQYSGSPRNTSIDYGLYVAKVIHHDLTVAEVSSWQWWLAMSPYDYSDALVYINDPQGTINPDNAKEDGRVLESKQLWAMGNFSRFIRPGMQRVEASLSEQPSSGAAAGSLMVSAYKDTSARKLVIVIINEGTSERKLSRPETLRSGALRVFTTDARRNLEKSVITGDHFTVGPRSVTTLLATY
ncbi:glycosyl hydrolase family 2 [Anseongella ginsenosidimutans]|uniref:Glycosyl hydrolase family 2 n=1 Tax=Anseongella ginsenosidimutans TaxID=496056 RepID=A0A4R3KQP7_9SPHI|nr:glycoside hydrolase [Anseongella ginsenosidimutans]TCS85834.1 glycosyl hydrolase family 2 [Anseongella ginsenosidimutans]